jgi:surfactin synthase thioesterase subunit
VIAQFGHEMGKTVAFEMAKSYVDADPTPKAAGPLAGQFVTIHGSDDYNSTSNVRSAAFRIHMF